MFVESSLTNSVTTDPNGNLYIVDTYGYSILKLLENGTVVLVAGGSRGSDGDGGLATLATFDHTTNVAVDSQGQVFPTIIEFVKFPLMVSF